MTDKMVEVERSFKAGDIIVKEGAPGSDMFIIKAGKVAVTRDVNGREMDIATLGTGNFFGEMSLLESLPRSATVRALTDTKLIVLRQGGLLLKIRRDPTFALEMLQRMSGRLRYTSDQFMDLLKSKNLSPAEVRAVVDRSEFGPPKGDTP